MRFHLSINCNNDAFAEDDRGEVARIVTELLAAWKFRANAEGGKLYDVNGNAVGAWAFLSDDSPDVLT